ncbi:hypothetical protein JHS3_26370 [Jeongeupia sp. HS-3]|nr:hypothetical protein JHS3_26370 [Jeongeupia sp. HS-3]
MLLSEWQTLLARLGVTMTLDKIVQPSSQPPAIVTRLPDAPLIGIGISAANKLKELGEDKLREVIVLLIAQTNASIVLIGGADDSPLAQRLMDVDAPQKLIDATGKTTLAELPWLLTRLSAYLTVDSGIAYLADACGIPVVLVAGPTDPAEQRPLHPDSRFIIRTPSCYPCSRVFRTRAECWTGTRECITDVSAEEMVDNLKKLLLH